MKHAYFLLPLLALSLAATAQDEAPAADTPAADAPAATDSAAPAAAAEEETVADGNVAKREGEDKASDATLRLREKLKSVDTKLAEISNPTRSLQSACKSAKLRVERSLPAIDKNSQEVVDLQAKFNQAGSGAYEYEKVSADERMKYVRDGEAAYKAMLVDMKEKKSKRKIGGLDKFEIMRERYQGIPEYTQAHEWYIKTMKSLDKKWKKMAEAEKSKRKNLQSAKAQAMTEADKAEFDKLAAKFKESDEDIASVWYNPSPRNAYMLNHCLNKVEDVLRRNEKATLDKEVGTVPTLLEKEWAVMDEARDCMLRGQLEEADRILKADETFNIIKKLKTSLLPNEYREPLVEQRGDMAKEIQRRMRDYKTLKQQLERQTRMMDQSVRSAEAQLDNVLAQIEKEHDQETTGQTAERDELPDNDEEESGEGEAEGAAETDAAPAEEKTESDDEA